MDLVTRKLAEPLGLMSLASTAAGRGGMVAKAARAGVLQALHTRGVTDSAQRGNEH